MARIGRNRLTSLMQPIGLRLDATHHRFDSDATGPTTGINSLTVNLSYRMPMTDSPLSPYVIAGAGAYRLDCVGEPDCESDPVRLERWHRHQARGTTPEMVPGIAIPGNWQRAVRSGYAWIYVLIQIAAATGANASA